MPGIYPRIVNRMLIRRSAPHPRSRKTPRGGKIMARMILKISLHKIYRQPRAIENLW